MTRKKVTFILFHGDMEDYKREFLAPLGEILNRKEVEGVYIDFTNMSFVSKREAGAVGELLQTLGLLSLPFFLKNLQPSVSLAFARWMPGTKRAAGSLDGNM